MCINVTEFFKSLHMVTQSPDTHPKIEEVQISLIRNESIAKRISRVRALSATTIKLSRRTIKRANPGLEETEIDLKFVSYHYGEKLAGLLDKYLTKKQS